MGKKPKGTKEDKSEDCCFLCKDGGPMRICDEKNCLKTYHAQCLGKDDSFLEEENHWECGWHSCAICNKASTFQCYCCPIAVCRSKKCMDAAKLTLIKEKKGLCDHCLTIARLIESKEDADSDDGKVDFDDRNTYEYMFNAYWPIVKEKENLTSQHVISAAKSLKSGKSCDLSSKSNESDGEKDKYTNESQDEGSESDESEEWRSTSKRKRSHKKTMCSERKTKSNKKKFNGWGSEVLINFLSSIGKDTTKTMSQFDVSSIITEYCREKKLFNPEKKKQVICNAELERLLGRKFFNRTSLLNLLEKHLAENQDPSDDDFEWSSEDRDENVRVATNKEPKEKPARKCHRVEENVSVESVQLNSFAAIVPRNLKHVYLTRSMVQLISKNSEDFENKLTGSYVRIKSDPNDYTQKNSYMLVQVSGLLRQDEILLQVSNMVANIPISKLSDDNFSEKECEDLLRRMKTGWPKLPTVVELQEKATSLHQDITKNWIEKEIAMLRMRMNRANEKGWRKELTEDMDRIKLLQTESEQSRLLSELPEIIVDKEDIEPAREDSHREVEVPKDYAKGKEPAREDAPGVIKTPDLLGENYNIGKSSVSKVIASLPSMKDVDHTTEALDNHSIGNCSKEQPLDAEPGKEKKETAKKADLVSLSSDDDNDDGAGGLPTQQGLGDVDSCLWYCVMPNSGFRIGPYCMSLLKEWRDDAFGDVKFNVFKIGQNPGDAINLDDAIHMCFPRK